MCVLTVYLIQTKEHKASANKHKTHKQVWMKAKWAWTHMDEPKWVQNKREQAQMSVNESQTNGRIWTVGSANKHKWARMKAKWAHMNSNKHEQQATVKQAQPGSRDKHNWVDTNEQGQMGTSKWTETSTNKQRWARKSSDEHKGQPVQPSRDKGGPAN